MTMSPDRGGIFDTLLGLVRHGLGGRAGDGRQYVSWIHDQDFVRAVCWLIESRRNRRPGEPRRARPVTELASSCAPCARRGACRSASRRRRWMLEIGALLLRTETELILKSRRVIPGRLLEAGFTFEFPTWAAAAENLCRRWREMR